MDNDYTIKLGPESFALLHDIIEERAAKIGHSQIVSTKALPLLEVWAAVQRADQDHECVDDGYKLHV